MKKFKTDIFFLIMHIACIANYVYASALSEQSHVAHSFIHEEIQNITSHNKDNPFSRFALSLQAVEQEERRQQAIHHFIVNYVPDWIKQGFNLLYKQGVYIQPLSDILNQLIDDNLINDSTDIDGAIIDVIADELLEKMKVPFLQALTDLLKQYQHVKNLNWNFVYHFYHYENKDIDEIFYYVIAYKDSYLKDYVTEWINDWQNYPGDLTIAPENLNKIKFFLKSPLENLFDKDQEGKTVLLKAVIDKDIVLVHHILSQLYNQDEKDFMLHTVDFQGLSPLHYAVLDNNINMVIFLLHELARSDLKNLNGDTPLHIACLYGYEEIVDLLLKSNASMVHVSNNLSQKPLYLATFQDGMDRELQKKHERIVEQLIKFGARVDVFSLGYTPLHLAVGYGYYGIAEILLNACLDQKISFDDIFIENPFFQQCKHENISLNMIKLLYNYGVVIDNQTDESGISVLGYALYYPNILEFFLQNGADVNFDNFDIHHNVNIPLLHEAVRIQNLDVIRLLLQYGADINKLGGVDNETALHEAVNIENIDVIKLLIDSGADRLIINKQKKSPLQLIEFNQIQLQEKLKKAINTKSYYEALKLKDRVEVILPEVIDVLSK